MDAVAFAELVVEAKKLAVDNPLLPWMNSIVWLVLDPTNPNNVSTEPTHSCQVLAPEIDEGVHQKKTSYSARKEKTEESVAPFHYSDYIEEDFYLAVDDDEYDSIIDGLVAYAEHHDMDLEGEMDFDGVYESYLKGELDEKVEFIYRIANTIKYLDEYEEEEIASEDFEYADEMDVPVEAPISKKVADKKVKGDGNAVN